MKATLLIACGLSALLMAGCESDLPPNPNQPPVAFGNSQFRDEGVERPAPRAGDLDRRAW